MPTPIDLHQHLKNNTQTFHLALHRDPLLSRLTEQDCTLTEYRAVLRVFLSFYTHWETRFVHVQPTKFTGEAPVLTWLRQDLQALGDGPYCDDFASEINDLKTPANYSAYLGYLYIKQGSTLGGQVLCRQLQKSLKLTPVRGLRFFYGFGDQTRQQWLDVLDYFQEHEPDADIPMAVASASSAFRQLKSLLEEALKQKQTRRHSQ